MILSDRSIAEALASGRLVIEPIGEDALQPASVDIRLDRQFRVFQQHRRADIDVRESVDDLTDIEEVADDEAFVLHPGEFVLGSTLERVKLGDDIVARVEGKSSLDAWGCSCMPQRGVQTLAGMDPHDGTPLTSRICLSSCISV